MISYHRLSYIVENILNLTGGQTKQISDTSYSANTTRISKWEIRSEVNNKKYFKKFISFAVNLHVFQWEISLLGDWRKKLKITHKKVLNFRMFL